MQGIYKLKLGEVVRTLNFNNFSHIELSKALFQQGHLVSDPSELIDKMLEMSRKNVGLLLKALVYAGIVGDEYENGWTVSITQQEVGKLVAHCDTIELEAMWDVFMEAMGKNLAEALNKNKSEEEAEEENEDSEEKKS